VAVSGRRPGGVRLVGHSGHRTVTARLAPLLDGAHRQGIYRWRSRAHPRSVARELARAGWGGYALAGEITGIGALFDACATALAFPAWYGRSREAFGDCLSDLSWLPGRGYVLIWPRYGLLPAADPKGWRQAYEALDGALAVRIRYRLPPLFVLLRGTGPDVSPVDGTPIPVLPTGSS
jgi:hypothetical protein